MVDWLESTARALRFYGGVPQLIVPDNAKAMISQANVSVRAGHLAQRDFGVLFESSGWRTSPHLF
jgi:transposase